jgi:phytoene synthase
MSTSSPAANDVANSAPAASGSSFYTAMRILPKPQREAMYAVYAFCRAVDDIADDPGPRPQRIVALDRWRQDIDALYDGRGATALTGALPVPVKTFDLRKDDFLAVIDGMEMDARQDIVAPSWELLDLYCDRVASAVGRLSVRIFGVDDRNGHELAHHLGRALQLTNILRDIDEDGNIGRLYLPQEALTAAGISSREIPVVLAHPALGKACSAVADRARQHFRQAEEIVARCPRATVRSPRLMASVYRAILDKLVEGGWDAPRTRVRPTRSRILLAILRHGFF